MTGDRPSHGKAANPPVVLLGGFYPTFSVARSFAARGIEVHGLGESGNTLLGRSRAVTSFTPVPDHREERWHRWFATGPRGSVVLPCSDAAAEFTAQNRSSLEDLGYVPTEANDSVTLAMLDKGATYDLARKVGIPTPRIAKIRERGDLEAALDIVPFPCALKPHDSYRFGVAFPGRKAFVVSSHQELEDAFAQTCAAGLDMLLTEIIFGADSEYYEFSSYYSYLDEEGEPLFHFTKRKLRQYPVGWGTGSYHESTWDPEVAALGIRFLQGVGLRGIGNPEFKRDRRDGRLKLIECNIRPTAADKLLQLAGLDLGYLSYRRALGERVEPLGPFREGVRQWDPTRDLRAFLDARRVGRLTTREWLGSLAHVQHFPIFDVRDLGPSLALTKQFLVGLIRRPSAS